jgi:O-methyltransferase
VKKTFGGFSNVEIIKGAVPHTLSRVSTEKVAFLSIDMNCVQPELGALDFFWPKMVSGGVIVLDDFAYQGFDEQNSAHTEWAKRNKIDILTLSTGQGLIIKP